MDSEIVQPLAAQFFEANNSAGTACQIIACEILQPGAAVSLEKSIRQTVSDQFENGQILQAPPVEPGLDLDSPSSPQIGVSMQLDEIGSVSDQKILDELAAIGVSTTLEEFKNAALKAGSPSTLSDEWASLRGMEAESEDFLYSALLELWKRHLADVKCAEAVQDSFYDVISYHGNINHHNKDSPFSRFIRG